VKRHPVELSLIVAALVLGASLFTPPSAKAHAFLVRSTPEPGERLGGSPASIDLQFSAPAVTAEISVKEASGVSVTTGPIERLQDGLVARWSLPPLGPGIYVVSWQDLSVDGHSSIGEFAFAVGAAGQLPTTVSQTTSPIAWPDVAASWLFLVPLFLAFGGLASERFVWTPVSRQHSIAIPRLPVGQLLAMALLGSVLELVILASRSVSLGSGSSALTSWAPLLTSWVVLLSLWQLGLVVIGLRLLTVCRVRTWVLLPLAAALTAAAFRGHPGTSFAWWAGPANAVHIVAVALWVGGLGHLVAVVWQKRSGGELLALAEGARRYAALALGLVAVVVLSGAIDALAQVTALSDLLTTTYGQVLSLKLLLVAATLGFAFAARRAAFPTKPGLTMRALRHLTGVEGALLLGVLAAAAVLANAPPPSALAATDDLLGPAPMEEPILRDATVSGLLAIYLDAGDHELRVRVLAPSDESAESTHVTIEGLSPDGREFDVAPRPCGQGCVTSAFDWERGTTTLAVSVLTKKWGGGNASFSVDWPPQSEDRSLLDRVIETMRAQSQIALSERVSPNALGAIENHFSLTGDQFVDQETYAAGGASDVRPVPAPAGTRALTMYISGSAIWYYLEVDPQDRLVRERIVDPGHLIERTFRYDTSPTDPPAT
jgi:copper transport protein